MCVRARWATSQVARRRGRSTAVAQRGSRAVAAHTAQMKERLSRWKEGSCQDMEGVGEWVMIVVEQEGVGGGWTHQEL